jgi:hypothetical protein
MTMAEALTSDSCCFSAKVLKHPEIMQRQCIIRRFTLADPCPICGGHDTLLRGQGVRCFGYYDRSGKYARCTREERAGSLPQNRDDTYSHRLHGTCRCGQRHGQAPGDGPAGNPRPVVPGVLKRRAQQRFRSFFTLTAYLKRRYGEGTTVRHWIYRDAAGHEVFRVLRIDYRAPAGSRAKSYRPCHETSDGRWLLARPAAPLPLYRLPAMLAAPPQATVTLLEGEKCADLATAIGLPYATTSAHGAKAPQLTDWSPLAGRHVAILGDEDEDGASYAAKIHAILNALDPPAEVQIVRLPGLAEGEDIEQFIEARRSIGRTDADILAELLVLIAPSR